MSYVCSSDLLPRVDVSAMRPVRRAQNSTQGHRQRQQFEHGCLWSLHSNPEARSRAEDLRPSLFGLRGAVHSAQGASAAAPTARDPNDLGWYATRSKERRVVKEGGSEC